MAYYRVIWENERPVLDIGDVKEIGKKDKDETDTRQAERLCAAKKRMGGNFEFCDLPSNSTCRRADDETG